MDRLKSKNVVVTGAGNGIGESIAILFAKEGASVVVADLEEKSAINTVNKIVANGGNATYLQVDTSDKNTVNKLMNSRVYHIRKLQIKPGNVNVVY